MLFVPAAAAWTPGSPCAAAQWAARRRLSGCTPAQAPATCNKEDVGQRERWAGAPGRLCRCCPAPAPATCTQRLVSRANGMIRRCECFAWRPWMHCSTNISDPAGWDIAAQNDRREILAARMHSMQRAGAAWALAATCMQGSLHKEHALTHSPSIVYQALHLPFKPGAHLCTAGQAKQQGRVGSQAGRMQLTGLWEGSALQR